MHEYEYKRIIIFIIIINIIIIIIIQQSVRSHWIIKVIVKIKFSVAWVSWSDASFELWVLCFRLTSYTLRSDSGAAWHQDIDQSHGTNEM